MRHLICLMVLMMPAVVLGQYDGPGSAEITVTGKVVPARSTQQITFDTIYDVHFNQTDEDATDIVVDPIRDPAAADSGPGYIVAKGIPNAEFQITFSRVVEMRHVTENVSVTINYMMSHHPTDQQASSTYILESSARFRLNDQGEYHFWLGGRLSLAGAIDGEYDGEFTLEVEYL